MKRSRLFEYNITIKGDPKEKLGIFTQSRINIKVKLTAGRITLLVNGVIVEHSQQLVICMLSSSDSASVTTATPFYEYILKVNAYGSLCVCAEESGNSHYLCVSGSAPK